MSFRLALVPLVLVGWAFPVAAQSHVRGTVREQSGRPVAGAQVAVPNSGGRTLTDSAGRFRIEVPSGSAVLLSIAAAGLVSDSVRLGPLGPGEEREVAIVLRSLARLDAVTVVASRVRPLLNTADATTGGSVEAPELAALPTDARDPISLLYAIPGVAPATGFFGDAPRLSFNGGNALYSQYVLDGLDNNEGFLGGPRVDLPLAAIARMDALVNTYGVPFGRSPDGVVNITSRAGSVRRSSDAFVYSRPGRPLDARIPLPFGSVSEAVERRQEGFRRLQAGGSTAGALAANRTFYSLAGEYVREDEDRIGSTALAQFLGTETRQTIKGLTRVDHGWSPSQTTTWRSAFSAVDREGNGSGVVTPEADITTRRIGSSHALIHRSALRQQRASNTLAVQFSTFRWYFPPARSDFSQPQVTVVSPAFATEAVVGSSNFVFDETERQWQFRNVFETMLGTRHSLRAGIDVLASSFRLRASSTNPNGSYVVFNDGNIPTTGRALSIRDIPANVRVASYTIDARPQQVNLTQTQYGLFVEDTWRPASDLTVTGGLRWDYDDLTSRGASRRDLDNLQPRLSVNWHRTPREVIRAGIGRYTGHFPYAIYSDAIQLGERGNAVLTWAGNSAPLFGQGRLPSQISDAEIQSVPREVFRLFELGLEQPTSWQGTVGWQRQLGASWALSADVVLSRTVHLPWLADLNPVERRLTAADSVPLTCRSAFDCPGDDDRLVDPATGGFRRISTAQSGGEARYAALMVAARRAMTDRWQLDANWVWSRARNNTEDINFSATQGNCFSTERVDAVTGTACTSDEWADANNDRRHRVTLRSVASLTRQVSWSLIGEAQTGVPVNRLAGRVTSAGIAQFDLLGSGPIRGNGFIGNGDRFFGVARNAERLPSNATVATSLVWTPVLGAHAWDLRLDVFNLFNSLSWGGYANGIGGGGSRTQYGRPGDPILLFAAAPGRQIQLSARWSRASGRTR